MGLLNPGGPIAQFKRNRCSISPVELILQSGVRIYQFMDEINCEIAHQDIMASGYRKWKCLEALKQESQSIEKIDSLGFFEKVVFVHQCKFTLWKN